MVFFVLPALVLCFFVQETYHPVIKRRRAKELGLPIPAEPPVKERVKDFATVSLFRPIHMMLTEPLVGFLCLYIACEFATLFSFFAAVPYVFRLVYQFSLEQQGLVFLSVVVGLFLSVVTVVLCDVFLYKPQISRHPPHQVPPEYRLYPGMIASIGLPLGMFWFGWTARSDISWVSPVLALVPFSWGNLCLFISGLSYLVDTYHGTNVASAASANSFARYIFAGAFPLFSIQS
jgi:hypothetical protein